MKNPLRIHDKLTIDIRKSPYGSLFSMYLNNEIILTDMTVIRDNKDRLTFEIENLKDYGFKEE